MRRRSIAWVVAPFALALRRRAIPLVVTVSLASSALAQVDWMQLTDVPDPIGPGIGSVAYDSTRGRTIFFQHGKTW